MLSKICYIFYFSVFLRASFGFEITLNKLPLAKKDIAWVFSGFQTHSKSSKFGMETVRAGAGWEGVRVGCALFVCVCVTGADNISQIRGSAGRV